MYIEQVMVIMVRMYIERDFDDGEDGYCASNGDDGEDV